MSKSESGINIGDLLRPAEEAARMLSVSKDGVSQIPIVGGFSVAKQASNVTGDIVHIFELDGVNYIIFEPGS